jgi:peptidoglycan/LPS O-acetylase OafA/YrhL
MVMWVAMSFVLGWKPFTGSMAILMVASLVITIPLAWLLHRLTHRKAVGPRQIDFYQGPPSAAVAPVVLDESELSTSRQ